MLNKVLFVILGLGFFVMMCSNFLAVFMKCFFLKSAMVRLNWCFSLKFFSFL